MGAQQSIHAGKAKIDFNVDFTHKLCGAFLVPPLRSSSNPFSQIIGRLSVKHPNLFGRSEKLDLLWDKGLQDSSVVIAFRRPRPEWLSQQSFVIQHSITPEIAVHGLPVNNFSRSGSGGVNLCRISAGVDLSEPATSHWNTTTSIKFEHVRPINDNGRTISQDPDGFPLTSSGSSYDNMVILKQESQYASADDHSFSRLNFQMEQGLPLLPNWLIFNRFKFVASKGIKFGPALLVSSLTGGSIVGDMAPHQAFTIGGLGSVRGYGEGAIGSGRSCLVLNSEFTMPLDCIGMIDSTHVDAMVTLDMVARFRGRKGVTQNILATCTPNKFFTYILAGWEGSANDYAILKDTLSLPPGERLYVPEGKYYLCDAGYTTGHGFISPYRGVRYHLKEHFGRTPKNRRELFNLCHSSLRTKIEASFGILINRFKILTAKPHHPFSTQVDIVLVCAILHNYIAMVDPDDGLLLEEHVGEGEGEGEHLADSGVDFELNQTPSELRANRDEWKERRDQIAWNMWVDYCNEHLGGGLV